MGQPTIYPSIFQTLLNGIYSWFIGGVPKRVEVSLSSAQILALHTTPIVCVAAPASGYAIRVLQATASYVEGGSDYNGGALILSCNANDAGVKQFSTVANFLANATAGSSAHQYMYVQQPADASSNVIQEATALYVYVPTVNPTSGTSTVNIYITYEIIAL